MSIINWPAQITTKMLSLPQTLHLAGNALLIALWLWLYAPVLTYLAIIFSREDFRTNQLLLIGVVVLIAMQLRNGQLEFNLPTSPRLYLPALALAMGGTLLYLLVERYLDVNTLSASLFGVASYGLLGLWLSPRAWKQGLPAILLLIGALPFGEHMQTFIGYPMRILTASIVRDGLAAAGVASVGVDTILVLENGVSKVDLPCSGVRSLWTGALFLIAATWVMRRALNRKWLLVAAVFTVLLFVANLARVGVLVAVGQVAGWRLAAEMLHVPLGVLGFVGACATVVKLLQLLPTHSNDSTPPHTNDTPAQLSAVTRPVWLMPAIAASILVMGFIYSPRPQVGLSQPPPDWAFPADLVTESLPLKPDEFDWLIRDGAESADRRRFEWRGINGTMILITSRTWRAHHRPERCFEVYGLSLDDSRTYLAGPDFPLRFVALGKGQERKLLSASYWFQSAHRTTDDYATRIWADLSLESERWMLISILFDDVYNPDDADIQALYVALRQSIAQRLKEGASP